MIGAVRKLTKQPSVQETVRPCFDTLRERYLLCIIIFLLAILTVKDVVFLFIDYADSPKLSKMAIQFNESMSLPNVTFCIDKQVALSHLDFENHTQASADALVRAYVANHSDHDSFLDGGHWPHVMILDAYDTIAILNSVERETHPQGMARAISNLRDNPNVEAGRKTVKFWTEAIKKRNVTLQEFMHKVGVEAIRLSLRAWSREVKNDDLVISTGMEITWLSTLELCFQPVYEADSLVPIVDQGVFFKMLMGHDKKKIEDMDIVCMSVDMHGRPSSLNRFMEGKGRAKDGFNDELCIGSRISATAEVRALYQMLENDEPGTSCRDGEGEEDEFSCRSRCRMEMIERLCHCTAHTLSYLQKDPAKLAQFPLCDYPKCNISADHEDTDQECVKRCFRTCKQIRYELVVATKGKATEAADGALLTLVELNWGSFEYLTLEQEWVWSFTTFVAALGGSIGLWLGLSILTLIEGFTFLFNWTKDFCKARKEDSKRHSVADAGADIPAGSELRNYPGDGKRRDDWKNGGNDGNLYRSQGEENQAYQRGGDKNSTSINVN